ncbi:MAG: portal protein [Ignisphaera sp.]|nr:portal protein [Ignisphaera sp.]
MAITPNRNLFTAISKLFTNSKSNEFTARTSIDSVLAATNRDIAPTPLIEPTVISDKGVGQGSLFTEDGVGKNYHKYLEREALRHSRYGMYDRMDADLVCSALDVYANECTQQNDNGKVVGVFSSSRYIQDELTDLLETIGINNFRSWSILRNMCKYGDHFCALKLDSIRGVVDIIDLDPVSIYRLERLGKLEGYIQDLDILKSQVQGGNTTTGTSNPYITLNMLSLPYLTGDSSISQDEESLIMFLKYEIAHFRLRGRGAFIPYGSSVLDSAVDVWKKLDLLFDSLIIYRLNRAPTRLVFYVDVGNNQGADAENIVKRQINAINKKEYFSNGKLNERYQLLDMNANLFIPLGKNSQSKVDLLNGVQNVGDIEDVNFLSNRLFSALKVPKAFLGFEGDVSSKGMLSQQNVTFGKAIGNIQEDFLQTVKNICLIHLAIRGISNVDEINSFDLVMTRPSYIEEKAKIELQTAATTLGNSYKGFGVNTRWIAKNILHRTESEIQEMFKPDDLIPQQAPGMNGGMGGMPMDSGLGGDMGSMSPAPEMPPMQDSSGAAPAPTAPDATTGAPPSPTPLVQHRYRNEGDLLVENHTTVLSTKAIDLELKEYITLIKENGIATLTDTSVSLGTSLVEVKNLQLTEPEAIFRD